MADSTFSSQVTLITLEDTSFKEKHALSASVFQENQVRSAKLTKSTNGRNVWYRLQRKRKIGTEASNSNNGKLRKKRMAEQIENQWHGSSKVTKRQQLGQPDGTELVTNSFLLWLKSIFERKNQAIDVNKSYQSKLSYFVYVLPAFIICPAALKECSDPKLDEDFKLKLAAAHINDALNGRGRFGQARAALKSKNVQRCFKLYSSKYWEYLMYLFITLHCLLPIWEQSPNPVSVGDPWEHGWEVNTAVLVVNALCIIVYSVDITLAIVFLSWKHFCTAKENFWIRVECVFSLLFVVDFIVLVLERVYQRRFVLPFRCLRAAMLICKSKNVAHIFKVLVSIMSRLGKVFAIIFIFIFTFASIGLHLYMNTYHVIPEVCTNSTTSWNCSSVYSGAFDNVAIASLHMFVLMSTENYPDVIIPAFNVSWGNFFYFMFYLYAGVFFLTAILLAIIVESYWEYSKKHVKLERLRQREELVKAWNLLDPNGVGYLSVDDPKLLNLFNLLRPKNSDDENHDLIAYISENNEDLIIDSYDWTTRLVETLCIEFEPEESLEIILRTTSYAPVRRVTSKIVHAKSIGVTVLVLILVHSILFCLMWNGINSTTQLAIQILRSLIIVLFVLELILRIISDGAKLLNVLDILDISMVVMATVGNMIWYALWYSYYGEDKVLYLGACVVASSLAVLGRLLFNSEQARSAVDILRSIYPVMFDLILLVVTMIFFYAIIGLEIFQDKTTAKSTASGFVGSYSDYGCGVGFDTFGCAAMVVFQIVTTNDWHQIMLGAMIDAGWPSAIYFVSCYLIIDMIVMNLFVAISIEAYKKLARDRRDMANQLIVPDTQAGDEENGDNSDVTRTEYIRQSKSKNDTSFKTAAKNTLTGLFASTRTSKPSLNNAGGVTSTPYMGRRGTRGSITTISLPRTPQLDRDSSESDGELTITTRRGSIPGTPSRRSRNVHGKPDPLPVKRISVVSPPDSTALRRRSNSINDNRGSGTPTRIRVERRQAAMKARTNQRRQERKAQKQVQETPLPQGKENQLQVPEPKLSITDIVKLKKRVKVLIAYKAHGPTEMSLEEGQILYASEEDGDMMRGPDGWFPKTHIIDMDVKIMNNPLPANATLGPMRTTSAMRKPNDGKAKVVNFKVENELISDDSIVSSNVGQGTFHTAVQHRPSIGRMRRKTDGTDWRREILGDMTVMNKDEMQELNKKLKGGLHSRVRRNTPYRPQNMNIQKVEEIPEESEEVSEVPEVTISEAPQPATQSSSDSNEDTTTSKTGTLTLTVPGSTPKKPKRRRNGGEMPEWAKNFVAAKGLSIGSNQKIDELKLPSAGSSDEEDHLYGVDGVLVHRSDTSGGSSLEDLQEIPKGQEISSTSTQKAASSKTEEPASDDSDPIRDVAADKSQNTRKMAVSKNVVAKKT